MILQIAYSQSFDIENIKSFFKLFSSPEDKILFKETHIEVSNVKKTKIEKDLETIITKINTKESIEVYTIVVNSSIIFSFFSKDEVNSQDEIPSLLCRHIAYHFGFSECRCGGFTVKNKENNKIQVEETIYIKNDVNFIIPSSLTFVKSDKRTREDSVNFNFKNEFKTTSSILYSILSCKEVHFKSNDVSFWLKRNETSYVIYCDKKNENMFTRICADKETELSNFLVQNTNSMAKKLTKFYTKKDLSFLSTFMSKKKTFEKECDFLWSFLCVVPKFDDNRDAITEKLTEIFRKIKQEKHVRRKGEYLELKEERFVDSLKFNSLKRFYYLP
ncbi:integrator complex subunit 13 (INTS13) [Vairimorpha necatrix]|uniref:Integrator complex subunit 13 (INTS13) n=1 Tax=Vairimorpha necatrix TaxID=6039 RepID=A0AAX4J8P2_9MICR